MSSARHFKNNLDEKEGKTQDIGVDELLNKILKHPSDSRNPDTTIYTGDGGTIVLLLRLFETLNVKKYPIIFLLSTVTCFALTLTIYLSDASSLLDHVLSNIDEKHAKHPEKQVSFIEGYAGTYAIATVVKHYEEKKRESEQFKTRLVSFGDSVMHTKGSHAVDSDELLYGRAGCIHALLYTYRHTQHADLLVLVEAVAKVVVQEGRRFAQEVQSKSPLMYAWHEKRYTGFAHGLCGILYMIITVQQLLERKKHDGKADIDWKYWNEAMRDVRESVDFTASTVFPSGNYPTRDDGTDDKLVQWCHGAPAAVLLFCKAFEVFKDEKYKSLAWRGCDVVWERGLLRKGYGLCHGISGNAYCFLYTYKITTNELFLQRAKQFSTFGWSDRELYDDLVSTPSAPYSLFEGIGGLAYLHNDLSLLLSDSPSASSYMFPTLEI